MAGGGIKGGTSYGETDEIGYDIVSGKTEAFDIHIAFNFSQGQKTGLHIRNSVAVPTDGADATHSITCDMAVWADILSGSTTLSQAIAASVLQIDGNTAHVLRALNCFDVVGLQS